MKQILKKALSLILAVLMLLPLVACASTEVEEETKIRDDELFTPDYTDTAESEVIEVSAGTEYQTIIGFGGTSFPVWIGDLTEEERQLAFGNGGDELGFTILRLHIDPDSDRWAEDLDTAKAAQDNGAIIIASPWTAPDDMMESYEKAGEDNPIRIKHDKYAEYAEHLNNYVTYMKENGIEIYAISFQNEPDLSNSGWVSWTTEEIKDFILNYSDIIDCKLMTPESYNYDKEYYDAILNDEEALEKIDIFATHLYGTKVSDFEYPLFEELGEGKELWITEMIYPNSTSIADMWPEALETAEHISDVLTVGNMQAYVWWYIRRFYGPIDEYGDITKRGYCMAQYSKFVRPGYVRIDATEEPADGISVSAFKSDDEIVIVVINNSENDYEQHFNLSNLGFDIGYIEAYTTSKTQSLARTGNISYSENTFGYVLDSYSITTFVISES
ncbi:MAG: glucuronoxylanase [Oscillospiraceae bacterium]|nr:glucuronoxylanase [Oscillospiraceae bacterium]